ncbi:thioredoxin-like protein [Gilbertella persicaria]|uniref:thioredoxin-like protein n=1 Tax=Gilbertella persicaria TaxID=101096 RepID=UPI00221EAA28|nr:thioredoxin-like protein [Gilbertella persicaria]KAI8049802.1 thioredoxin-like protein [Gilbertella persicaria]
MATLDDTQKRILEQYQSETKIEDTAECIRVLKDNHWDLKNAIQNRYYASTSRQAYPQEEIPNTTSALLGASRTHNKKRFILSLFMWPFNLVWRLCWHTIQYTARLFYRPSITAPRRDPRSEADRFLREFESCFGTHHPPFFHEGGYAKALQVAKDQLKYLLVILTSEEHDHHEAFCRDTLTRPELLEFLHQHQVMVWGGNARYTEAFQVSHLLQATTYPFLAIIALQSTKMAVVDRIEGPVTPSMIIRRFEHAMQRVGPSLDQLRQEREQREAERRLRQEQDRAYQESLRADQEKQDRLRQERESAAQAAQAASRQARNRQLYISQLVNQLPGEPIEHFTKISFRLANGERVIRKFSAEDTLASLYQFIEAYPYLHTPPETELPDPDYEHHYSFTIHSSFPRQVYDPDPSKKIKDEKGLWPSATLIVE